MPIFSIIKDTLRREGKWGFNMTPTNCPKCNAPLPAVRKPTTFKQGLWGGWTCQKCGCEVDKWGKEMG